MAKRKPKKSEDSESYIGGGYKVTLTYDYTLSSGKVVKAGTSFFCTKSLYNEIMNSESEKNKLT